MGRPKKAISTATPEFENSLWAVVDIFHNNMETDKYKYVILDLIFLKYISDTFDELYFYLAENQDTNPEDQNEYFLKNVFWVPKLARWSFIQSQAINQITGKLIYDAIDAIENSNKSIKGLFLIDYTNHSLDNAILGELISRIGRIGIENEESRSRDILRSTFNSFLNLFSSTERMNGRLSLTPQSAVRLIVDMLAPYQNARIFDPACGMGSFFVQTEKFIENFRGKISHISFFGQESNTTLWKLAKMNLAMQGIDANLGSEPADSFLNDLHADLKADFIMSNPPFNMRNWYQSSLQTDKRWKYGIPPSSNANFGWAQHIISHLSSDGMAGFILPSSSSSSNTSGQGEIRKAIIEDDLVDCIVYLPGQLFYSSQTPVCLWILAKNKAQQKYRNRKGETLFIDARKLHTIVNRVNKELCESDIQRIVETYHSWRGDKDCKIPYENIQGFCHSANIDEIKYNNFVNMP